MSQQAQAENLHATGVQRFEEARTKLEELHRKHQAGELSGDAYRSEAAALDSAISDAQTFLDRARQLNTIDRGRTELSQLGGIGEDGQGHNRPDYLRPMGGGTPAPQSGATAPGQAFAPQQLGASPIVIGGMGLDQRQLLHVARLAGVQPHTFHLLQGRDRAMLNRFIRGPKVKGDARLNEHELAALYAHGQATQTAADGVREHLNVNPYIDRDGAYVTAHEVRNEVIGHLRDIRHIRSRARVIATNAASVSFPTFKVKINLKKTRAHKGKVDGSGSPNIRDVLGKTEFTPHGSMETIKIPEELIEDLAYDLIGHISEEIAMEAFDDEERAFLVGSGIGEAYGVLKAPIVGVPHTGSGSGNADFRPEDIKTLPFELRERFRANAVWMGNKTFFKAAAVLRTEDGGANTGQFLFQPGLRAGDPPTLGGFETLESEFFPDHISGGGGASQAAGDPLCLFGDWRNYWIVDRLTLQLKVLDQTYADEGQIGFRYRKRLDGAPVRLESWVRLERK